MADKQATIYVVDVGCTTGEFHNGRNETDLEYGLRFFWSKITETIAADRITWSIGVIAFRTNETINPYEAEGYGNIAVLKNLGKMELSDVGKLRSQLVTSNSDEGDAISAVVVAISEIDKLTQLKNGLPGKFTRKIFLLTDGQGTIDPDGSEEIIKKINECGIELVVIGIDFDDPDFGFKEENKAFLKSQNESLLKDFVSRCDHGVFSTAAVAIQQTSTPCAKTTKPYLTYEGTLELGDPKRYPKSAISIDVRRYFKTRTARPPPASRYTIRKPTNSGAQVNNNCSNMHGDIQLENNTLDNKNISLVRIARTYKVDDPSGPEGKLDVKLEKLAKGYMYGRTIVPMNEVDASITKFKNTHNFAIIGFIPCEKYEKYLNMGESCITIAQPFSDKARMAMSSLVHALHELDSYAVARIMAKGKKEPSIILLAPYIQPGELEALFDIPLPFAEDVRAHRYPPLDRVVTSSGSVLKPHGNLPKDQLTDAMSDYVDSMDLLNFRKYEDGLPMEYMPIEEVYNPYIHRINNAIIQKAICPHQSVLLLQKDISNWSKPPHQLVSRTTQQLERLISTASLKKVQLKAKGKRKDRDIIKPLSGLDIDALLGIEKPKHISIENAIPEFRQMISKNDVSYNVVASATEQMSSVIRNLITRSCGNLKYPHALECMKVIRNEIIDLQMPDIYNEFVRDLKSRLSGVELGEKRNDFLYQMRSENLGLIDYATLESSKVTEEEAQQVICQSRILNCLTNNFTVLYSPKLRNLLENPQQCDLFNFSLTFLENSNILYFAKIEKMNSHHYGKEAVILIFPLILVEFFENAASYFKHSVHDFNRIIFIRLFRKLRDKLPSKYLTNLLAIIRTYPRS